MTPATADPSAPGWAARADRRLFRDLRSGAGGLSSREAARRLAAHGPNELVSQGGARWPGQVAAQLVHPLALLL